MAVGVVKTLRVPLTVEAQQRRPSQPAAVEHCVKASLAITLAAYSSDSDNCIVLLSVIKDDGTCEQERWQVFRTRNASLAETAIAIKHGEKNTGMPDSGTSRACVSFSWDNQKERRKTHLHESRVSDQDLYESIPIWHC